MNTWMYLKKLLKLSTIVNDHHLWVLETENKYWHVLEIIVAVVKSLPRHCLASRSSSKILFQHDNGNFINAVEMLSSYEPGMREHLRKVQNTQKKSLKKLVFKVIEFKTYRINVF